MFHCVHAFGNVVLPPSGSRKSPPILSGLADIPVYDPLGVNVPDSRNPSWTDSHVYVLAVADHMSANLHWEPMLTAVPSDLSVTTPVSAIE